jgi:hypothetical protein
MYMSLSSKLKSQFIRPIVVGIVSAAGAAAIGMQWKRVSVPLLGDISKPTFYGVLGAASSLATESIHQWLLPMLPQSEAAITAENALLAPAIHAAVNVGFLQLAAPRILEENGYTESIIIGAGAEVVGSYSFDAFVKPNLM